MRPSPPKRRTLHVRVQAGGAKMDKAVIKPSQWGYGVFATDTILPGEVFLEVPQALSLGEANVNRSAVGPVITDLYSNPQLGNARLASFQLHGTVGRTVVPRRF